MANVMCNTQRNDVKNALREMRRRDVSGTLTQVGKSLYSKLDKDRGRAPEVEKKRAHKYIINRTTETIHKKDCRTLRRVKPGCKISAALVNISATGLKTCGICM